MVAPAAGVIVSVPFPFSDLSASKLRPALIIAPTSRGDWVLCQITSKSYSDKLAIKLTDSDFKTKPLKITSYARPGKLFTAHKSLFVDTLGTLKPKSHQKIVEAIVGLLKAPISAAR